MRSSKTVPFNPSNHVVPRQGQYRPQESNVRAVHDPRTDMVVQNAMGMGVMDDFFKDFLDFNKIEDEIFGFSSRKEGSI